MVRIVSELVRHGFAKVHFHPHTTLPRIQASCITTQWRRRKIGAARTVTIASRQEKAVASVDALYKIETSSEKKKMNNLLEPRSIAKSPKKRVWDHRPQHYASISFAKLDSNYWHPMSRSKFRMLLDDCMATGEVSLVLETYLQDFDIMEKRWSDQELVLIVSAFIKNNQSSHALKLLKHQLKTLTTDRLNRVAAESARLGNAEVAIGTLEIAKQLGFKPDVITYTAAIHARARGSIPMIQGVFDLLHGMIDCGIEPNDRTYGAATLAYARLNKIEEIDELLDSIPYSSTLSKENVFAAAIITCSRARQFKAVEHLIFKLIKKDMYLGEKVTNSALSACARASDFKTLEKVVEFMRKHATPSIYTYNTLISAYGNTNRMEQALQLYDELVQNPDVEPDLVTYNALLWGTRRSRRTELIPMILDQMEQRGLEWDVYTLNALLEGCIVNRDVDAADRYWKQAAKVPGFRHDRANWETLIGVYLESGDGDKALNLWSTNTVCRHHARSAKTLNYLLRACIKRRDPQKAVKIMDEFVERGQRVTAISYNHMLSAYLSASDWKQATEHLQRMTRNSMHSTMFAFTSMMHYAVVHEQYREALDIFDHYHDLRHEFMSTQQWCPQILFPSDALYMLAMRAAVASGDHERVLQVAEMLPDSMSTTMRARIVVSMMESCQQHDDWLTAVTAYDDMSNDVDDELNDVMYKLVVQTVAKAGAFERALDVRGGRWYRHNRRDHGWFQV